MILKLLPLLLILQDSGCSVVTDSLDQKGIYLSDFCPRMEYCAEGAHVMCMYYDPNRAMGPRCSNPQNVTITAELANQLLDITNAIRSKIALGKETGSDDVNLPRGYGVFRVRWDNELATFAQVLANQCVLRHDLCRATKRFSDPGQTAGLVRFTNPDWMPISKNNKPMTTGLNNDKLTYSVTQTLKSWYSQKTAVTEEMLKNYPDWSLTPALGGRLYLEMIHGSTTHMGCGMSAYTEFAYYDSRRALNYNSIQMICNFSSRPKTGEVTYNTSRPSDVFSSPCGCPEGTEEDSDCLCSEVAVENTSPGGVEMGIQTDPEQCTNPESNCESTVVLLPIFTIEDAPPEKVAERTEDFDDIQTIDDTEKIENISNVVLKTKSMEILDFFEEAERQHHSSHHTPTAVKPHKTILLPPDPEPKKQNTFAVKRKSPKVLKDNYYPVPEPSPKPKPKQRHMTPKQNYRRVPINKKSSIFNRVAKFSLPNDNKKTFGQYKTKIPDVKPRKNFKNMQKVVNDYIKKRNNKIDFRKHDASNIDVFPKTIASTNHVVLITETTTEAILNRAEESVMNFNPYVKPKANISVDDSPKHFNDNYEENDNKLMNLLDTLEQEVKHIELDGTEKEIFDAKIRKIYGSVVGKPVDLFIPETKPRSQVQHSLLTLALPSLPPPLPPIITVPPPTLPPFLPPLQLPQEIRREPDLIDSDLDLEKSYLEHKSGHDHSFDLRSVHDSDRLSEDERNFNKLDMENKGDYNKKKHFLDGKYVVKFDKKYKKNLDPIDQSDTDNDMFGNDHALYSDIERKYNERLRKYTENSARKRGNTGNKYTDILASRTQNNLIKYDNYRHKPGSNEDRKMRGFDKYRDRQRMTRGNPDRNYYRNREDDTKRMGDRKRKSSYQHKEFDHDDPLSEDRRRFYQEKLENIERRLHNARSYRHRNKEDRGNDTPSLRMRPNRGGATELKPRSKVQGDSFYMPDRARFLHGF